MMITTLSMMTMMAMAQVVATVIAMLMICDGDGDRECDENNKDVGVVNLKMLAMPTTMIT